jgi:hypothetical protein
MPIGNWAFDLMTTGADIEGEFTEIAGAIDDAPEDYENPEGYLGLGVFLEAMEGNGDTLDTLWASGLHAVAGDADHNRDVNGFDIQAILSANKFGTALTANWEEGDFTGDFHVNGFDIQAILSANWFGKGPYASQEEGLRAPADPPEAMVEATFTRGDTPLAIMTVADLIVTPDGVTLDTNGLTINGYVIQSALGIFTGDTASNLGYFREDTDALLTGNMGYTLNGTHGLGDVIGSEYSAVDPQEDLTFTYTINGQAGLYTGTITIGGGEMAAGGGGLSWLSEVDAASQPETAANTTRLIEYSIDQLMATWGE